MIASLIASQFDVDGRLVTVAPMGDGNVNDTYLALFRTTFSEQRLILQRINQSVFSSPETLMHNMRVVTDHAHRRLEAEAHLSDRIWQLPRIIPSRSGQDFAIDAEGGYWRAISYIASAHSFEKVQNLEHAHQVGLVLGHFQRLICDLPVDQLSEIIPDFHITPTYLESLDRALETDEGQQRLHSSSEAEHCLRFIQQRREWCSVLEDAKHKGLLQARPIHGDPKVGNVMIDDITGKGTCIVDLDTVMPGLIHYDFGDALRSCCNPAGEETTDLSSVIFDVDLCREIIRGYLTYASEFLTKEDRLYLYDAIRVMTFELGLRFYTDFIKGNVYFKSSYDGQNLHRARVQFKLVESIEIREPIIRKMLK
jgi:Ser/Thr protein kinase RdoA (MazF antagonist)